LAHTHLIRSVRFRGDDGRWYTLGWCISDDLADSHRHLTIERTGERFFRVWLCVPQFVEDTVQAIGRYASDLRKKGTKSRLFSRFKRGYEGTAAVFREHSATLQQLRLNAYSQSAVDWVKHEVIRTDVLGV